MCFVTVTDDPVVQLETVSLLSEPAQDGADVFERRKPLVFAAAIEDILAGKTIAFAIGKLNPVIGEDRVALVGQRRDQVA